MEMPDFDPTASAQYVRYARGTNVPNGAKRHGPAAYSRVLPLNRLGTASTSSRRDSSASSRHGPSLAHIRAGTDRHGAVSAIAKRATAKLGTHACQPQMAAALSSPAPAQMWPAGVSPGPSGAHSGEVCACEGARRRGAADRGRVSALARCALRRHSDPRNRQALRGMVRSHRSWKHSRLRLIPTYWPRSRSRPTFRFQPICEHRGAEVPMVCYDCQRPFRRAAMAERCHDRTARSGHVSLELYSFGAVYCVKVAPPCARAYYGPAALRRLHRRAPCRPRTARDRPVDRRGRAAAGGRWWLVLYRCPLTNPAQPPGLALIYRSILDGAPDRLALVLKLCTTHAEQVGAIFRSAAALFAAGRSSRGKPSRYIYGSIDETPRAACLGTAHDGCETCRGPTRCTIGRRPSRSCSTARAAKTGRA